MLNGSNRLRQPETRYPVDRMGRGFIVPAIGDERRRSLADRASQIFSGAAVGACF